ncbi:MAG: DUF4405 domain-containing protein [Planctomycetota bacterium]|jgi:hypothetical protein
MTKRGTLNFVVVLVSFINLVFLALIGLIMKYVLPPGSGGRGHGFRGGLEPGQVKELWSMTRHEWGDIHFYFALFFLALMTLHIVLHWNWIKIYLKSLLVIGRKTSD